MQQYRRAHVDGRRGLAMRLALRAAPRVVRVVPEALLNLGQSEGQGEGEGED